MKWAEVNEVFDEQLEPLLELVRFKSMTINYLHDVVTSDHPIASTVARFPLLFEEAVFYHAFSKVTEESIYHYSERLSCSSNEFPCRRSRKKIDCKRARICA